jgi:Na+-translocating ferredoxin:NAD+ oxidoreductase RnfD subunit
MSKPERERNIPAGILYLMIAVYSVYQFVQIDTSLTETILSILAAALLIGGLFVVTRKSGSGNDS